MTIAQTLIVLCWGIFLFYWIINWKNVKPTAEKKSQEMIIRIVIIGIIALVLFGRFILLKSLPETTCQWSWFWCQMQNFHHTFLQSPGFQVLSVLLAVSGLWVAITARRTLAGNWSSTLDLKKGHELITSGIYHYVRHPIYTGALTMLIGSILAFPTSSEVLIVFIVIAVLLYRIKKEEELLTKTFPKDYPAYKRRTKTLIPYIW